MRNNGRIDGERKMERVFRAVGVGLSFLFAFNSYEIVLASSASSVSSNSIIPPGSISSNMVSSSSVSGNENEIKAKPFIIDLDFETDVDDVCALRIADSLMENGVIDIKGVMLSAGNDLSASAVHGLLCYDDLPDIPIGKSSGTFVGGSSYWEDLAKYSDPSHLSVSGSVELYKKILNDSIEKVNIVTTGYLTNVANVLKDDPDLFKKKVRALYVCGGDLEGGWENNLFMTEEAKRATIYVVENINVPIVFITTDVGGPIKCGGIMKTLDRGATDPVTVALRDFGEPDGRVAWDPMAVWIACVGSTGTRTNLACADITVRSSGDYGFKVTWAKKKTGKYVARRRSDDYGWYERILDSLIAQKYRG